VYALSWLALLAGCLPARGSGDGPREEVVVAAELGGETLHLTTEWEHRGDRERGRRLDLTLSDGTCRLVGDEYDFASPPRMTLADLDHDVVAAPHAILHPVDGGLELVFDDGRPRRRYEIATGTRVRWILDTTLVLIAKHRLVDLETGREVLIDAPEWAHRFALAGDRVLAIQDGQLAAFDVHLHEVPAPAPALQLYVVDGAYGVDHLWQHRLGDEIGWTHVRGARAVALTGFRGVAPYAVPATWLTIGPGTELAFAGAHLYARIDGEPFELSDNRLSRVPAAPGAIVSADARSVVLANPAEHAVWVSIDGGPLAPYSYNGCAHAGR